MKHIIPRLVSTVLLATTASMSSTGGYLSFVSTICGKLKTIKRTGWVRSGVPLPESDADHMHRCCMCAMLAFQTVDESEYVDEAMKQFHPSKLDKDKLLRMTVSHDLCESLAGDITPHCGAALLNVKEAKEQAAMEEIRQVVGDPLGKDLFDLWREYEDQVTVEAIYCKDIDKFEMVVQAFEYEAAHLLPKLEADDSKGDVFNRPLRGFFSSTSTAIKTPLFKRLDRELRGRREAMLKEKGWDVTDEEQQRAL
jgi:putative hydrolase of HD superfamily